MRRLLLVSVAVLSCACQAPTPTGDAGVDAQARSFDQPMGAACNAEESPWCAHGLGICHDAVCCAFCSAVALPRCAAGTVELHETVGGHEVCLCTP